MPIIQSAAEKPDGF